MPKCNFSGIFLTIALLPLTAALGSTALRAEPPDASGTAAPAATPAAAAKAALPDPGLARAGTPAAAASAAPSGPCSAAADLGRLARPLTRTARRLAAGEPIKIVAVGSSSTAGAGASSPAAAYPSRLAQELKQRFPAADITVVNRGVNGEEAADMVARLDAEVIAEKPDLVLWQLGTNAVLRDQSLDWITGLIKEGVRRLKAAGADIVLIDPQFSPKVTVMPEAEPMVDLIARTAKQEDIGVFHRYAMMQHWRTVEGLEFSAFLSPDQLHMNDWSYACVAKVLGGAIADAANRSTAIARTAVPQPR